MGSKGCFLFFKNQCIVFNAIINEQQFTSQLQLANVALLFKKCATDDAINYRQILITCALSNIFETLLADQMNVYSNKTWLLSKNAFVFRKNLSN